MLLNWGGLHGHRVFQVRWTPVSTFGSDQTQARCTLATPVGHVFRLFYIDQVRL
ncbi:protein of unknown function [Caballeronia sp. S22]